MTSREYLIKAARIAETREKETADIIRMFESGLSRTQIHRALGLAYSTVADRLEAAGYPKSEAGKKWTEEENALIARFAEDTTLTAAMIAHHFPGRSESGLSVRLRVARLEIGIKPANRLLPPSKPTPIEETGADEPSWPLPPGAMRGLHGITLPRVSILMEARHG